MLYNLRKVDDNIFTTTLDGVGRDVSDYYSDKTDKVLVEPNSQFDGGKIYCSKDSWIKRGDIIKVSDNWYVVSQMSNLASDVFNVGVITMCDVNLMIRLGKFVYDIPCVVSKYSGNSNVRGIIDDSVDGQLSFITGYRDEFEQLTDSPCVNVFGKTWQVGNCLNVNNVMTVYCQGKEGAIYPEIGIEPIEYNYHVGDTVDFKIHVLNISKNQLPDDIRITVAGTDMATVDGTKVTFNKPGRTFVLIQSTKLGASYQTEYIDIV